MEAVPKAVFFTGITPGRTAVMKVLIVNRKSTSIRLKLMPSSSLHPFLKYTFPSAGLIAPGLSQILTITYSPQEFTTSTDIVQIESENEMLFLPISCFPTKNIFTIEKCLNFGDIPLCKTVYRVLFNAF